MAKKDDETKYPIRPCRLRPVTGPTRCGGCGAEYVMPKYVQGSELQWMMADGWRIDAELMTIRCPVCVDHAERMARVLAS